jgi:PhnB protein
MIRIQINRDGVLSIRDPPVRLNRGAASVRVSEPAPESSVKEGARTMPIKEMQPYLFFDGRCDEALQFYQRALGAQVTTLMRYKESPEPGMSPPGADDKVMHSVFRIGNTVAMASDGRGEGRPRFAGFALSLTVPGEAEADRLFGALADGGQVQMPMMRTFFSPRFGMVADRFGVSWMIIVAH